jgi:hypothetical protein
MNYISLFNATNFDLKRILFHIFHFEAVAILDQFKLNGGVLGCLGFVKALLDLLLSYPHIYSHINMVFLLSPFSSPFGVSAPSQHFQPPLFPPAVHDQPDCIAAHIGAKLFQIGDAK